MSSYSTRQLAALLGMPAERIRALARTALVAPRRTPRGHLRFSFQDLVLLRTAKSLLNGNRNARRVWRALRSLGRQLGASRSLSSIRMQLQGSELLATAGRTTWHAESGQTVLDFSRAGSAATVEPLAPRAAARAGRAARREPSAEEWFELGIALEQTGTAGEAEAAYRRAFEIDPAHVDSRINLGRLRHAAEALEEAEALYREALGLAPGHAIVHFNLGVVLEDRGTLDEATKMYERALALDPTLAEAHYNLARLFELRGDERAALRHLSSFKRLQKR
jgi:tetratricopeptide (TPR) repeat protein